MWAPMDDLARKPVIRHGVAKIPVSCHEVDFHRGGQAVEDLLNRFDRTATSISRKKGGGESEDPTSPCVRPVLPCRGQRSPDQNLWRCAVDRMKLTVRDDVLSIR